MRKYINSSLVKFKNDLFSKAIYDIGKWGFLIIILSFFSKWIPGIKHIIFSEYKISVYTICLTLLIVFMLGFFLSVIIYKRKLKQIKRDNFIDDLTGLKNHKALELYITNLIAESKNKQKSFSIILIDIDDFKNFNDNYGYNTADLILKKVGELLGSEKRSTDETFRKFQRGDEFVVILKDTNLSNAYLAAERRRKLIDSTFLEVGETQYSVTVSCGITEFNSESDDEKSIIDRVSKALSNAKKQKYKNNTQSLY